MNLNRVFGWMLVASVPVVAQTSPVTISTGHTDLGVRYSPGISPSLGLMIADDDDGVEYRNSEAFLVVSDSASLELPPGTPFGPEGALLWILPQTQEEGVLFLGLSGETIGPGVFHGALTMRLKSLELPGYVTRPAAAFFIWQAGGFGQFDIRMDSTDGISDSDAVPIEAGAHAHYNWGFSTSGLWHVTFQIEGRLSGAATNLVSTNITVAFQVMPLRPFERWQSTNWPPATACETIGPLGDPDQDGVVNLFEYGLALNPKATSRTGLPGVTVVQDGGEFYGALTFRRAKYATDIRFEPVAADSVGATDWIQLTEQVIVEDQGEVELVTVRDSLPIKNNSQRFYRLRLVPK